MPNPPSQPTGLRLPGSRAHAPTLAPVGSGRLPKAWALYGLAPALRDEQPLVNEAIRHGPMGWHMHDGGHSLGLIDWKHNLDHADDIFRRTR